MHSGLIDSSLVLIPNRILIDLSLLLRACLLGILSLITGVNIIANSHLHSSSIDSPLVIMACLHGMLAHFGVSMVTDPARVRGWSCPPHVVLPAASHRLVDHEGLDRAEHSLASEYILGLSRIRVLPDAILVRPVLLIMLASNVWRVLIGRKVEGVLALEIQVALVLPFRF